MWCWGLTLKSCALLLRAHCSQFRTQNTGTRTEEEGDRGCHVTQNGWIHGEVWSGHKGSYSLFPGLPLRVKLCERLMGIG